MKKISKKIILTAAISIIAAMSVSAQSRYVAGDFHQHTTYTDGNYSFGYMMEKNNQFGLDWWANSEHGGAFNRWGIASGDDLGSTVTWDNTGIVVKGNNLTGNNMWRWQSLSEWSFRDVQLYRRVFPDKLIIESYEMNVPGHEHASMGVLGNQFNATNPDVDALASFEYLFDANDLDDSQPLGITETKMTTNNHAKAVASVKWLQDNYPEQSYVIPAHPERYRYSGTTGWNIEHLRDLNNAAPDVFFGFESFPGHQMSTNRGEYGDAVARPPLGSYGICTYGGCGWMSAKIGGLWDALLSEGRHFWLFANSDCHNNNTATAGGDFFPGEYQKTYTYVTDLNAQAIIAGLRSGNSWVVTGDLIDSLSFTIGTASMGGNYTTDQDNVTINTRLRDPQGKNNNTCGGSDTPELHHFDLIAGVVTDKISPPVNVPADGITGYSDAYKKDSVETTKVIARFGKTAAPADPCGIETTAWADEGNGMISISYPVKLTEGKMYFRLRGTNQPLNTLNETDACGNPLPDSLMYPNTAVKAFADLWFYSNPVFVTSSGVTGINQVNVQDNIQVYPNPANDCVYVTGKDINEVKIFSISGVLLKKQTTTASNNRIDVQGLASGIYMVQIKTGNNSVVIKKIVKQ